jgi:hypothetical protein
VANDTVTRSPLYAVASPATVASVPSVPSASGHTGSKSAVPSYFGRKPSHTVVAMSISSTGAWSTSSEIRAGTAPGMPLYRYTPPVVDRARVLKLEPVSGSKNGCRSRATCHFMDGRRKKGSTVGSAAGCRLPR